MVPERAAVGYRQLRRREFERAEIAIVAGKSGPGKIDRRPESSLM
jgi:hypothetical protein